MLFINGETAWKIIDRLGFPIFLVCVLLYWFVEGFVPHNELLRLHIKGESDLMLQLLQEEGKVLQVLTATCLNTATDTISRDRCIGLRKVDP